MIWATSNAVNVTDGLDGLGRWLGADGVPRVHDHRLCRIALSGDLRSSGQPARPRRPWPRRLPGRARGFCGSTPRRHGSSWATSVRSRSAPRCRCLALTLNTQLLLILICGINVIEAGSVAVQMIVFKASGPQEATVPDVADSPPLRTRRLARNHGHHPFLADFGNLRRERPGAVHRRLHQTGRSLVARRTGVRRCDRWQAVTARLCVQRGYEIVAADDAISRDKRSVTDARWRSARSRRRRPQIDCETRRRVATSSLRRRRSPRHHHVVTIAHG